MSSCHHAEQRRDNNIKCGDRTRGGGAAVILYWGHFITHNVLDWRLLDCSTTEVTVEELHRRRMWRRNSRPGADELRHISCDRIYQLWSRSVRLRHLSLHRAIRAAGVVDCVQCVLLIMCNDGHVWTKHLHRWSKLVCWYASEVSPLYHAVWL